MQAPIRCPGCGEFRLYQSRSRNWMEKFVKRFLPFRIYRCHNCNWRGWIAKHRLKARPSIMKTLFFYTGVIIIALIVALLMKNMIQ